MWLLYVFKSWMRADIKKRGGLRKVFKKMRRSDLKLSDSRLLLARADGAVLV
ncbi:hypothetical protein Tcan_09719 [Toxocara canis]|uniref:Uncharacterized protein n=1 Tax=Toxocara canis TaxID=6265 RepID=A0A0B2VA71_TOXCA|nr:hypothetical protein Tcan_09719 [Toxocara canis]